MTPTTCKAATQICSSYLLCILEMSSTTTGKKKKNNKQQNGEQQTAFVTPDFGI